MRCTLQPKITVTQKNLLSKLPKYILVHGITSRYPFVSVYNFFVVIVYVLVLCESEICPIPWTCEPLGHPDFSHFQ